jgi:hypothetical protein
LEEPSSQEHLVHKTQINLEEHLSNQLQ